MVVFRHERAGECAWGGGESAEHFGDILIGCATKSRKMVGERVELGKKVYASEF